MGVCRCVSPVGIETFRSILKIQQKVPSYGHASGGGWIVHERERERERERETRVLYVSMVLNVFKDDPV